MAMDLEEQGEGLECSVGCDHHAVGPLPVVVVHRRQEGEEIQAGQLAP